VVIGDSLADWLGYGLEETFAETPEIGFVRKIRAAAGLVRYEPRNEAPDWPQAVKDMPADEKPQAIIVMLGLNDRLPLRAPAAKPGAQRGQSGDQAPQNAPTGQEQTAAQGAEPQPSIAASEPQRPGASYEFHTDKWAELYAKRIDDMIAALKAKGVPVIWVGLPAIRGTRSTSDMSYLDELFRERAEKAGITYVDVWDGFVDEQGRYTSQGPDFEGQIRRLRTYDGIHFTKAGAEKLAHYVEHELRRVLANRLAPVALPSPDEQSPKGPGGARPAIGPVVPLTATGGGEREDLVGAGSSPAPARSDPLAASVFSRGDAIPAPGGRADNFSWPRADIAPTAATAATAATEPASPPVASMQPAKPSPAAPPPKAAAGKGDTKKLKDAKSDARAQAAPPGAADSPPRPRRAQGVDLDGAPPRPPLPIGR